MCFNIEYSCHTIANIIHGRRLSLQLMTNKVVYSINQWKKRLKVNDD